MRALPRVEVFVEPESFTRDLRGRVSGRLWLEDADAQSPAAFPEVAWSDFPVSALAAWIPELRRLARALPAGGQVATCRFLDGPYSFTVRGDRPGAWRVACWEERTAGRSAAGPQWVTDQSAFLEGLARAARRVLSHCDARGWWDDETETLRRRVEGAGRSGEP